MTLTPAERRGALVIVLLFALGAGHDLWSAAHPSRREFRAETRAAPAPPARDAGTPTAARGAADPANASQPRPLDLNRADVRALDALPGIGPVLAARIVEYRRAHGPFHALEDLLAVRGIGPRLLERLRPFVAVGTREPSR